MPRTRLPVSLLLATAVLPAFRPDGADPFTVRSARLDANRIATSVSNTGIFADGAGGSYGDVEYPRGSGFLNFAPFGLWVGANVSGPRSGAFVHFASEFRPGPMAGSTYALPDTTHKVYRVSRSDTTGWADWMAHAVPLGAPTDSSGTKPGILGSQTLWTVYNDADPLTHQANWGATPLGIEVRQTVWAFKEHGARDHAVLLRWRIENKGVNTLDSVYVGVWGDPDIGGGHSSLFGTDSTLGMAYSYPDTATSFFYGDSIPAFGLRLLEGARATAGGPDLGATAMPLYFHGPEPANAFEFGNVLRGLEVGGQPIVDPTSGLPSVYRYTGNPFGHTGWVDTLYADMRFLVASGPFTMAPGDTQQITAALVFGPGASKPIALDSLYTNAQTDFFAPLGEEYVDPGPEPEPEPIPPGVVLSARPNPSSGAIHFSFVPADGESYKLAIYDVRGRYLTTVDQGTGTGQRVSVVWASSNVPLPAYGPSAAGGWPGSGVYFAVLDIAARRTTQRVILLGD